MILTREKNFYKTLWLLALPIAMQNIVIFGLNALDTIMLGNFGEPELAAAGLANQPFFVLTLFIYGLSSGGCVLVSQYRGGNHPEKVPYVMSIALIFAGIVSEIFFLLVMCVPHLVMRIFTPDQVLIELGSQYLRIVGPSYILTAISTTYLGVLRGVEEVKVALKINVVALLTNSVLNLIFIYGYLGCPALGIRGAAIATLISRVIEILLVIYYVKNDNKVSLQLHHFKTFNSSIVKDFAVCSLPVVANETFWGLGVAFYSVILGNMPEMGSGAVAAFNMIQVVDRFITVFLFGVANASCIIIGKEVGANRKEKAVEYGKTFLFIALAMGIFSMLLLFLIRPFVFSLFALSKTTTLMAQGMLVTLAIVMPPRAINALLIVGIFRGGGDTRFAMLTDIISVWGCSLVLGTIAAYFLGLPPIVVFFALECPEYLKVIASFLRFRSNKWMKNINIAIEG